MTDDYAQAVVNGIRALQALIRDGDPQCPCEMCALIRASIRIAQGEGDAAR